MSEATQVREKPILFSGEMVRAILEGRKTQTRRVCKQLTCGFPQFYESEGEMWHDDGLHERCGSPYGAVGDRLWVRETFHAFSPDCIAYAADGVGPHNDLTWRVDRWRPSIFMPRRVSRITLEITGVRVERLRSITERDAAAEGVQHAPEKFPIFGMGGGSGMEMQAQDRWRYKYGTWYRNRFIELWDSLNEKRGYGWDVNPWVWVIEFVQQTLERTTGRSRFRTNWRGRLILQVEWRVAGDSPGAWNRVWRDARVRDIDFATMYFADPSSPHREGQK
jgi:hypothetical protein